MPTKHRLGDRTVWEWGYRKHDDAGLLETIGVEVLLWATVLKLAALQSYARPARDWALRTNQRRP